MNTISRDDKSRQGIYLSIFSISDPESSSLASKLTLLCGSANAPSSAETCL